jgi:phosphopantetheine adenylyltransferase
MNHELEKQILLKLKPAQTNQVYFCANFLSIAVKGGAVVPLIPNNIQIKLNNFLNQNKKRHVVILKARQEGVSTFIESLFFKKILLGQGKRAFIMSHSSESTDHIFNMTKLFYRKLPEFVKMIFPIQKSNGKILSIQGNDSYLKIGTAGGNEVGRGTTNNYIHASEVAYWKNMQEVMAGLVQSVGDIDDNVIIYESTANGNNHFRELFEEGLENKEKTSLFFGWHEHSEYRTRIEDGEQFILTEEESNMQRAFKLSKEQLKWRRNKIAQDFKGREFLFKQEYPIVWQEAFLKPTTETPLIEYVYIHKAVNNNITPTDFDAIVVGVDTARTGNDRTVITIRQGRKIIKIFVLIQKTAPEIEGFLILNVIQKYNIDKIFIDYAFGKDIADHLQQNGYKMIEAIHFSQSPYEKENFVNIRSEMHEKCREWFLQDGGVDIPSNSDFIDEISSIPDMKVNATGKLYMPPKDDIKELNRGRSPDYMDALCLTFAKPIIKKTLIGKEIRFDRKANIFE